MADASSLTDLLEVIAKKHKRQEALYFEGRTVTYKELDETANKMANVLEGLGIKKGDRVAIMLPNIPDFIYAFFGVQKIGAVAVPFNTMYKGREITHILNDCGAKIIITLSNFANLINEVRDDVPTLEHVVLTGQRTLVLVSPESTVNVQMVVDRNNFEFPEQAFRVVGEMLVKTLAEFGVDAYYKHRGGIRVGGKKIATVLVSEMENLLVINSITFIGPLPTDDLFRVIWVSPEIKDKVVEPSTSIQEQTGTLPDIDEFANIFLKNLGTKMDVDTVTGQFKRDELFGYEKTRSLAGV